MTGSVENRVSEVMTGFVENHLRSAEFSPALSPSRSPSLSPSLSLWGALSTQHVLRRLDAFVRKFETGVASSEGRG